MTIYKSWRLTFLTGRFKKKKKKKSISWNQYLLMPSKRVYGLHIKRGTSAKQDETFLSSLFGTLMLHDKINVLLETSFFEYQKQSQDIPFLGKPQQGLTFWQELSSGGSTVWGCGLPRRWPTPVPQDGRPGPALHQSDFAGYIWDSMSSWTRPYWLAAKNRGWGEGPL